MTASSNPFKNKILALAIVAALAGAASPATAASYHLVLPVPGQGMGDADPVLDYEVSLYRVTLPGATVGQPYEGFDFNHALSVTGDPNYTSDAVAWQLEGTLPAGLSFDDAGRITGTPVAAGQSHFKVIATYKTVQGEQTYTIDVDMTIVLASATLPTGTAGEPYPGFDLRPLISVSGDTGIDPQRVSWALAEGDMLPGGLVLDAQTGVISGTPTVAGQRQFEVVATYESMQGTQSYTIAVDMSIVLASATLPEGVAGLPYPDFDLKALVSVNGDPAFEPILVSWSLGLGAALPDGLELNSQTGVIAGTPTIAATGADFTVQATYKDESIQQAYSVSILDIVMSLDEIELPDAHVGAPYAGFDFSSVLDVAGDPGYSPEAVTWSSDSLPDGLSLTEQGQLTGRPTVENLSGASFTVQASYKEQTIAQAYSVTILNIDVRFDDRAMPDTFTAYAGQPYEFDFDSALLITGDKHVDRDAIKWSFDPAPPEGMSFVNGVLSGTPVMGQTVYNYALKVEYKDWLIIRGVPLEIDAPLFWLNANGVTVHCPGLENGETFELQGKAYRVVYTKADAKTYAEIACTSNMTDMSNMDLGRTFNAPISHWDTSNVTTLSGLFAYASAFNQPIGAWDTSKVTDMSHLFFQAVAFNQPIGGWNTSNVTDMGGTFFQAYAFDQDISGWDRSKVTVEW